MFPDPTLQWQAFPSIIDGIETPPFVHDMGCWLGKLHLVVVPFQGERAYGVQMECEIYAAFDEFTYSVAGHGARDTSNGKTYIREAKNSALLRAYARENPNRIQPRHFLFVGGDYCYEVVGSEPVIQAFQNVEEAYAWGPDKTLTLENSRLTSSRPG